MKGMGVLTPIGGIVLIFGWIYLSVRSILSLTASE